MPKSEESESNNYYCGIGKVPRGKVLAPVEYCIQHNQVRYYGLVAIDRKLLTEAKGQTNDLNKEKIKLTKIKADIKILLKDFSTNKIILENKDGSQRPSNIKKAEAKRLLLLKKRDKLKKQYNTQAKIIENLEKEEKRAAKEAKKEKKKKSKTVTTTTTTTTKSGSKTSKPKSKSGSKVSKPKYKSNKK